MRITNIVLGLLFILFGIVQINDPDPILWILLYAFVAGVYLMAAASKRSRWVALGGIALCSVWLLFILPEFINWLNMGMPTITASMKAEEPHIEYTREFLGLGICITALIFNYRKTTQRRNAT